MNINSDINLKNFGIGLVLFLGLTIFSPSNRII